jgi:hypothetical protein
LEIPIIPIVAAVLGAALETWSIGKATILASTTMTSPVAMVYTFLVTLAEKGYIVVFWAMEKTKGWLAQARSEGETQRDREWQAWYEWQQAAFREGRLFTEPPPNPPENRKGS